MRISFFSASHLGINLFKRLKKINMVIIFLFLMIIPVFYLTLHSFGVIFTYSGSVPIGFYRIKLTANTIRTGSYIAFCLPDTIAKVGLERGYIHAGACKNGSEELIKEAIAVPGDTVTVNEDEIIVDNNLGFRKLYAAPARIVDKNHLLVYRFIKNGIYFSRGYWVYGFYNPRYSWDSRYYGEIPKENIKQQLTPLWLF